MFCAGGQDLIEVGHPSPGEGAEDPRQEGLTVLHLGPVGAGRQVATDDQLRQEFAYKVMLEVLGGNWEKSFRQQI